MKVSSTLVGAICIKLLVLLLPLARLGGGDDRRHTSLRTLTGSGFGVSEFCTCQRGVQGVVGALRARL